MQSDQYGDGGIVPYMAPTAAGLTLLAQASSIDIASSHAGRRLEQNSMLMHGGEGPHAVRAVDANRVFCARSAHTARLARPARAGRSTRVSATSMHACPMPGRAASRRRVARARAPTHRRTP
jgi:hypothetical protein